MTTLCSVFVSVVAGMAITETRWFIPLGLIILALYHVIGLIYSGHARSLKDSEGLSFILSLAFLSFCFFSLFFVYFSPFVLDRTVGWSCVECIPRGPEFCWVIYHSSKFVFSFFLVFFFFYVFPFFLFNF